MWMRMTMLHGAVRRLPLAVSLRSRPPLVASVVGSSLSPFCSVTTDRTLPSLPHSTITPQQHRTFHASSLRSQAVQRRRRRGGMAAPPRPAEDKDDADDKDATSVPRRKIERLTDPQAFEKEATRLLDTVYQALQPLRAINDPFVLSRDRDPDVGHGEYILLDLGPLHGQYTLQVDPEQTLVYLQSPTSGMVDYYYSIDDGEWRSVQDDHILQGLLVRDLIRQIQGVPKL